MANIVTMTDRLAYLWPEIVLFIATCLCMVVGLSPRLAVRRFTAVIAGIGLAAAGVAAALTTPVGGALYKNIDGELIATGQTLLPGLLPYVKVLACVMGLLLLLVQAGTVDRQREALIAAGRASFDPLRSNRAEYYSFFLFSIMGLMLCASASDLIWLFLALELTSLPTYVMVSISSPRGRSQEAGVKYFFLGALGAAIFLYGFALIYGGTGSVNLNEIHAAISAQIAGDGQLNPITLAGLIVAALGLCFKVAAVPMHFYTADVYQGAAAPVGAFLAFVPKAAGFVSLMLLLAAVGWTHGPVEASLPEALRVPLWVIAALTMTVGNVLAIFQSSVKRILAYSSIAHSGYMLVGLIAGPGDATAAGSGLSAVLFYLAIYGVMSTGVFAVLAALERGGEGEELETVDDLRGLCRTRPLAGWVLVVCTLSLLGFPPLAGFFGKVPLFTSAISAGEIPLVLVLGLNSAIAAYYYLRLVRAALLEEPEAGADDVREAPRSARRWAAGLSAAGVLVLTVSAGCLLDHSLHAVANGHDSGAASSPADRDALGGLLRAGRGLLPAEQGEQSPPPAAH